MERISVTDFWPIQHAEIEIKPFCILIGHTSSGKSTVAKLLDLFNSQEFYFIEPKDNLVPFISLLKKYDIDFDFKEHTCIVYKKGEYTWTISKKGIETDYPFTDIANEWYHGNVLFTKSHRPFRARIIKLLNLLNEDIRLPELQNFEHIEQFPDEKIRDNQYIQFYSRLMHTYVYNEIPSVYIPAERILMSVLSKAIFSFYEKGINIPDCLKIFANKYSLAKDNQEQYKINFLNLEVHFDSTTNDKIRLENGEEIELTQASSGLQSIIPLLSVFDLGLDTDTCTIIEEPELNLYTQVQKDLTEYLVKRTKEMKAKLFITTHSPYILSTVQNLLQAGNVAAESPEKAEQVAKLVSPDKWIDYKDLTCQFFSSDGTSHNILDDEYHTIGINQMDDVSAELSEIYDSLLDIKYNE